MSTVQKLYDEFVFAKNEKRRAISRKFLPFLREEGPDRDYLLEKFAQFQLTILHFDFTADEFTLLESEKYGSILLQALSKQKFELAYAIGKTTGKYGICCRFENETTPREILEELNHQLEGRNIATCFVQKADLKEMLHYGLIPCPYVSDVTKLTDGNTLLALEYYRQGLSEEEIEYWIGVEDSYDYLCKVGFWSLVTKSYCEEAAKVGNSYPSLFHFPELLYHGDSFVERVGEDGMVSLVAIPASQRPKTDMSLFQTPVSHKYSSVSQIPAKKISVTRYASGMSKGLFYGDRPIGICGYFYYAEPESATFLSYENPFIAFNKTAAAEKLLKMQDDDELRETLLSLSFNQNTPLRDLILQHIDGILPEDLKFTVKEAEDLLGYDDGVDDDLFRSPTKVYLGKKMGLYAYEDGLDQPLCIAAAKLGYDIVILTHMVGSHQVVTEVLDTRDDSLKNLWFKK